MRSDLFRSMIDGGLLTDDHKGGCVLFEKREQILKMQKKQPVLPQRMAE